MAKPDLTNSTAKKKLEEEELFRQLFLSSVCILPPNICRGEKETFLSFCLWLPHFSLSSFADLPKPRGGEGRKRKGRSRPKKNKLMTSHFLPDPSFHFPLSSWQYHVRLEGNSFLLQELSVVEKGGREGERPLCQRQKHLLVDRSGPRLGKESGFDNALLLSTNY